MKRQILWTQTTTYASDVQVSVSQVARWAAGSKILRTTKKGMTQRHPSPAEVEQMMSMNEQFSAFITAAYCRDLGLLRRVDATALGVSSPTIQSRKS